MPDVETPAAEPSPAAAPAASPEPEAPVSVPTDPEAYAEWRQTGKLPDKDAKPSKREDSATSKKPSVDSDEESESATVSGTVQAGKKSAEKRIDQLTKEKEAFRRELEELKARAGKQDAKAPESSSVPPADKEADKRPVKPKQDDFKSWDEYETALDKYHEDLADFKASQRFQEFRAQEQAQAQAKQMQERLDSAKERYGSEAESKIIDTAKTVFDDKAVAPALKTAMGRSDVLVDALYVMGSDPDEFSSYLNLARTDPLEALRKWFTVESLVKEELAKGSAAKPASETPPRGPDGKFLQPAKVKVVTPAPPVELNGSASPPGDERERAAANGNFRSFKQDADRRDMQRMRGNT